MNESDLDKLLGALVSNIMKRSSVFEFAFLFFLLEHAANHESTVYAAQHRWAAVQPAAPADKAHQPSSVALDAVVMPFAAAQHELHTVLSSDSSCERVGGSTQR